MGGDLCPLLPTMFLLLPAPCWHLGVFHLAYPKLPSAIQGQLPIPSLQEEANPGVLGLVGGASPTSQLWSQF